MLALKKLVAVRLIKNAFYQQVADAEAKGANPDELAAILGRGRAKKGMYEGNMDDGELEIGQIAAILDEVQPAAQIIADVIAEFKQAQSRLCGLNLF